MAAIEPRTRVGDADREQAVADLQRFTAAGYLTLDEFSARSAAAYRATTRGDLAAVTQDLAASATLHRTHHPAGRFSPAPVAIAVAVVVVVVLAAGIMMAIMMFGMMGGGMDLGGMR